MNKLLLTLLVSPTLFGSVMSLNVMVNPVRAETPDGPTNAANCVKSPHTQRLTCVRLPGKAAAVNSKPKISWQRQGDEPIAMLDFTEEESDAAVALYGCDCPLCLNSLRQLRGLPPLAS
ncbi:MAG: hypothetical protein EAZ78_15485 [Oscillatoriales cyanobacterium]|nr:MAG: hypothetical protein EAZ98_24625 [Oscillatoriales cyanobacterium]TAD99701.1 MAG: hypothetical protein EAZ96_22510 [Oscillatoriales cyanobacterium]TAF02240.1 MAG: hypothetical protein EAZ78_15485 [Oscillatoriales cyanobacterium]TAF34153.1 MAG: hypothetical protein EAZ68_19395 [Oscillatoriales cyanobacterium]TAF71679.1 MAG: hypothetical protein EAZ59_00150 [Oscillatoriales cyanobacterium]